MELSAGSTFGPYRILGPLGRGAMAFVYRARIAGRLEHPQHIHEPVPEASPAEVVPAIAAVLFRCLAKSPAQRWPSAGAFAKALEEASEGVSMPSLESLPTLETPSELVPELVGQDSLKSFNTWSGAAVSAAKQIEAWLSGRLGTR